MSATCKTCPFFAPSNHPDVFSRCHFAPARVPVRAEETCAEHPARQRDRLAALAMNGLLAFVANPTLPDMKPTALAANAYRIADAMLVARSSTATPNTET